MNYPFDIGFTSAPGANDFYAFNTLTVAHNSVDATLELNVPGAAYGGLVLKSTPAQSKLTFGAEVMFTQNNSGSANHFGLWMVNAPESANYSGYRPANMFDATAPAGNKWYMSASDAAGTGYTSFPVRQYGTPAFALNTWFDLMMEYDRIPYTGITGGVAVVRFLVNGVLIGEYKDMRNTTLPVVPGIFLYNGKLKVRRMYASLTSSATAEMPYLMNESKSESMMFDADGGDNFKSETSREPNKMYSSNNADLTIRGRTLGEDFKPFQENVYVLRNDTMYTVQRVTTDNDGYYEITRLDSNFDYTIMIKRDGITKNVPIADYIGYGELAGTYRIRGETVGGVEVRVFSEQTGEYLGMVMTDSSGRFAIPNVNKTHLFALVFREPSGAWEDRVSSRRLPEIVGGNLTFVNTATENASSNGIIGDVKIVGGRAPYTVTVTGLPPGIGYTHTGDTVTFQGTSGTGGVYPITVSALSIDDFTGTSNFDIMIVNGFESRFEYLTGETAIATMEQMITTVSQNFATNPGAIATWADTYTDAGSLTTAWQSAGVWRAQSASYNDAFILKGGEYGNDMLATIETTIVNPDLGNTPAIGFFAIPQTSANVAFECAVSTGASNSGSLSKSNAQLTPAISVNLGTTLFASPKTGRHKYQLRMIANGAAMRIQFLIDDVVVMTYDPSAADIPSSQKYKIGVYIRSSIHDFHNIDVKSYR